MSNWRISNEWPTNAFCVGCGLQIFDKHYLRVSPNLEWHESCLKCYYCHQFLDETCTCYIKHGKTYCKPDYLRLFRIKCANCCKILNKYDLVMKVRDKTYHVDCFRCFICSRLLNKGDMFTIKEEALCCMDNHQDLYITASTFDNDKDNNGDYNCISINNGSNGENNGNSTAAKPSADTTSSSRHRRLSKANGDKRGTALKTSRMRTVLSDEQLDTLRASYSVNPRPDVSAKEHLVSLTRLPHRVINNWFQNKRSKDSKKDVLMRQLLQRDKLSKVNDSDDMSEHSLYGKPSLGSMGSAPQMDSSSVQRETQLTSQQVLDSNPWKIYSDYGMKSDIDKNSTLYKQLIGQVNHYSDLQPLHYLHYRLNNFQN